MSRKYRHLPLPLTRDPIPYTVPPKSFGDDSDDPRPRPDPEAHGRRLRQHLDQAWREAENESVVYHTDRKGIYLEFRGEELATKSLEDLRGKNPSMQIRLLNIRQPKPDKPAAPVTIATVFVPHGKRDKFFNAVDVYLSEERTKNNERKSAALVESIAQIRKALDVESFWQDAHDLIPKEDAEWCEVWLSSDRDEVIEEFNALLERLEIRAREGVIKFPERAVRLVHASGEQLAMLSRHSDDIAEYRRAKETAAFWLDESNAEQAEWAQTILDRLELPEDHDDLAVCILDTGVNRGHPLLAPVLALEDCQAVRPDWGIEDHDSHGTLMAGVAAYGDLQELLSYDERVELAGVLESVKILPPQGETDPELWGWVTKEGVSRATIQAPDRKRILCMATTATDTRDRGRPTSWSAALDQIASGVDALEQKLFIVSSGNVARPGDWKNYPQAMEAEPVHDPAQAWNALSVGAYTELASITEPELAAYRPIAPAGGLSPFSSTSQIWEDKKWPIKPEILMEGGNAAVSEGDGLCTTCDDLSVLSTFYRPTEALFWPFHGTSAAAAKAAWMAAKLQSMYPDYWSETIRGLMVHSAEWTPEMREAFLPSQTKSAYRQLLHTCGYGVPSLARARYSVENSLTLVAQAELQPFDEKWKNGQRQGYRTRDMHLYELPWPAETLQELPPETAVNMRVTLSYFVEPGPGEVGWRDRYRYPSHALRFRLNSPGESQEQFLLRINREEREDGEKATTSSPTDHWRFGEARNVGSIHSDVWSGAAQELATSTMLAIHPVIGWWRERTHLGRWDSRTRYALLVSIHTTHEDVQLYTQVAARLQVPVTVVT